MERCDVLIVGGGLAGLACARGLARAGLAVLLVEQKRWLGERVHTTGIFVRRTLEDFALPAGSLGPPIRDVILYSPARRSIALSSRHDEFRVGRMRELYRAAGAEAEQAGARLQAGVRFVGLEAERGGARVTLDPGGRVVHARFVVGADGARSRVAGALGLDPNRAFLIGVEDVYESPCPGSRPVMRCYLDPVLAPGYLAWSVDDGEDVHVGVAGDPARFRPLGALARFRASLGGVRGPRRERRGGRIPVGGLLARTACARGLLLGDASGAVSPLTAGGLDPCLRQARLAVEVIGAWLGRGDRGALEAYQSRRLAARFRRRRWLRHVFDRLRAPALVELAFAALAVPPLGRVAERVFFGRGSFPDLDLAALSAAREDEHVSVLDGQDQPVPLVEVGHRDGAG